MKMKKIKVIKCVSDAHKNDTINLLNRFGYNRTYDGKVIKYKGII